MAAQPLMTAATVALQSRVTQIGALQAILPGVMCEYLPGLTASEALLAQGKTIWRICW